MVTSVIFIGIGVKIKIYTGKYPQTLFILLKYIAIITQTSVIFLVSP